MGNIRKAGREIDRYRQANKDAKKKYSKIECSRLDTLDGERKIYR